MEDKDHTEVTCTEYYTNNTAHPLVMSTDTVWMGPNLPNSFLSISSVMPSPDTKIVHSCRKKSMHYELLQIGTYHQQTVL